MTLSRQPLLLYIVGIFSLLSCKAFASGWVKSNEAYYSKLYVQSTPAYKLVFEDSSKNFEELNQSIGTYLEYGLPTPWDMQVSLSGAYKTIERKSLALSDKFAGSALTDWELVFKHGVYSGDLFAGIGFSIALDTGFIVPMTPKKFRLGNESKRLGELETGYESRDFLIAGIDYGRPGSIYGVGGSFFWNFLWVNLSRTYKSFATLSNGLSAASAVSRYNLGFSLPSNSWVQLGFTNDHGFAFEDAASESKTLTTELSGGYTFYEGAALELSYSTSSFPDSENESYNSIVVGVSYRSL